MLAGEQLSKNVTFGLNRSRVERHCFITSKEKHETPSSALLISSEKIIAGNASLRADGA
jgi:hypothetical protein